MGLHGRVTIKSVSLDILRLTFSRTVAVNDALQDITNYSIAPITPNASSVRVLEIRGLEADTSVTSTVDVKISKPDIGSVYRLTVSNLRTPGDEEINDVIGNFWGRKSKTDSLLGAVPQAYYRKPGGTAAEIITAFALEDERIGGQGDIGQLPFEEEDVASTFGSGTGGSSTFGG